MTNELNNKEKVELLLDTERRELKSIETRLVQAADAMISDMEGVKRSLATGFSVNSLGEVQSRGSSFDILCALRQNKLEDIAKLEWLLSVME